MAMAEDQRTLSRFFPDLFYNRSVADWAVYLFRMARLGSTTGKQHVSVYRFYYAFFTFMGGYQGRHYGLHSPGGYQGTGFDVIGAGFVVLSGLGVTGIVYGNS